MCITTVARAWIWAWIWTCHWSGITLGAEAIASISSRGERREASSSR